VFVSSFGTVRTDWQPVVWGLAVLSLILGAVVALMQKDIKRMMAYSSINHVGFILLGVYAATTRGVSAALYYLFTYMFLTIGSFAVITVMARSGDSGHQISDYRGLARRQPVLALCFAVLLLGQAGVPFTTGFLAKFGVVGAAVVVHSYALATVAMVSAAIAAFFYLRVAVLMYGSDESGEPADAEVGAVAAPAGAAAGMPAAWASPAGVAGTVTTLNAELLLAGEAAAVTGEEAPSVVPVPFLTTVAIGTCVVVTVLFGIVPAPLLDLANHASLIFVSH
jgi:NADH-quinone oxidoreductase subunit N